MPSSRCRPLDASIDVEVVEDLEVLDNFVTLVEDSMESESVISVEVENVNDLGGATLPVGSVSDMKHLDVEVNNDDEIVAIDNTEVREALYNETGDQAVDVTRPSTSRTGPESRRKRKAVDRARVLSKKDHNHIIHMYHESDDSNSDTENEMCGEELIRKKLSLVKAAKRPQRGTFCDATAAKISRPSEPSVVMAGRQDLADAASHPVSTSQGLTDAASQDTIQGLLGENARLRQELASSSRTSSKYDSLIAVLQAKVECPVCYEVPKQAPVPVCSNGHVVCQTCKRDLCPTCRVRMGVATSVLAVTVIENIPHPCQFQIYGCQETCSLGTLLSHQAACRFRTVKCPNVKCDQRVPLSELVNHTISKCVSYRTFLNNITYNYVSANIFDDNRGNLVLKPDGIEFDGKNFFFKVIRRSSVSMWYFYVQMAGGEEEAKLYTATIHVFKTSAGVDGKNSHRFIGEVCPIDKEGLDTAAEGGYCCVLTDAQMRRLCPEEPAEEDRKYTFSVKVKVDVEDLTPREVVPQTENLDRMIQTGGSDRGVEASSDQAGRNGLRIVRRGRELSPLNLAQNSSQVLPRPSSPILAGTVAGPSHPRPIQPVLFHNTSSDTTSDEELVLAVSGDLSYTRVSRPRPRRHS